MITETYIQRKQKIREYYKNIKEVSNYLKHKDTEEDLKNKINADIAEWKKEIVKLGGGKNNINRRAELRLDDCRAKALKLKNDGILS